MKVNMKKTAILACIFLAISGLAHADWRSYAYSYDYRTARPGEREFELYTDYFPDGSMTNQIELEYGISDRWMASVYAVLGSSDLRTFTYTETKLSSRYRFGEAGQYTADPAIYLEYILPRQGENEIELKGILSKDFGSINLTGNLIVEKTISAAGWEKEYTLALSKIVSKGLRAGLEIKGGFDANSPLYLGPSIALVWGKVKINLVAGIGGNSASGSLNLRNIISFEY